MQRSAVCVSTQLSTGSPGGPVSWMNQLAGLCPSVHSQQIGYSFLVCAHVLLWSAVNTVFIKQLWHVVRRYVLGFQLFRRNIMNMATFTEEKHLIEVAYIFRGLVQHWALTKCRVTAVSVRRLTKGVFKIYFSQNKWWFVVAVFVSVSGLAMHTLPRAGGILVAISQPLADLVFIWSLCKWPVNS